jgi:hypothetical protein
VIRITLSRRLIAAIGVVALSATVGVSALAARSEAGTSSTERDARFWRQLTSAFVPGKALGINSMADHSLLRTPGGPVLALHFDKPNLAKASNLNWVAFALPGRFTRADRARVNRLYGPGFTHFHSFEADSHGGKPGAKGVWFVHIGTRNFTSPFGRVQVGKVDRNFMPTRPPAR